MKSGGILIVILTVVYTNYISSLLPIPLSTLLPFLFLMPARPLTPIEIVCAAAAVVEFVWCPNKRTPILRPVNNRDKAYARVWAN